MGRAGLCSPASVTSLPAKGNTEDHISNSCYAARRTRTVVENAQSVVAVELLLAAQALELAELDLNAYPVGAGTAAAWGAVRALVPAMLGNDRWIYDEIALLRSLVAEGGLVEAVQSACGPLWQTQVAA